VAPTTIQQSHPAAQRLGRQVAAALGLAVIAVTLLLSLQGVSPSTTAGPDPQPLPDVSLEYVISPELRAIWAQKAVDDEKIAIEAAATKLMSNSPGRVVWRDLTCVAPGQVLEIRVGSVDVAAVAVVDTSGLSNAQVGDAATNTGWVKTRPKSGVIHVACGSLPGEPVHCVAVVAVCDCDTTE